MLLHMCDCTRWHAFHVPLRKHYVSNGCLDGGYKLGTNLATLHTPPYPQWGVRDDAHCLSHPDSRSAATDRVGSAVEGFVCTSVQAVHHALCRVGRVLSAQHATAALTRFRGVGAPRLSRVPVRAGRARSNVSARSKCGRTQSQKCAHTHSR